MLPLFDRVGRLPVFFADALDRGATVLTANLRAARTLETAYAEDQRSSGRAAWAKPRILDWNSWITQLWEQCSRRAELEAGFEAGVEAGIEADDDAAVEAGDTQPILLTPMQEHQLWLRVLGEDRDRVVAPERMAELAQEAYRLLGSYRAHPLRQQAAHSAPHLDAERFLDWAEAFDRACRRNGWLSATRLEETLSAGVARLDPPSELCLAGFDRTTPAQLALLHAFESNGTTITRYSLDPPAAQPQLLHAASPRAEIEACAWWCRERLAHDPNQRIGVIVPDTGRVRAELDRVFRRILMPQTTLWPVHSPGQSIPPEPAPPYEFSLGDSLATLPVVRAALLLLRWLTQPIAASELTWLLTSGRLAQSAADHQALARLDRELRRPDRAQPEIALARLLDGNPRNLPAELRTRLTRIHTRLANARTRAGSGTGATTPGQARASHAQWAELVQSLLQESGWPGFRPADTLTFQAAQRWNRLLAELAELDFDGSQPLWSEFLLTLTAQAHAVIFAAESIHPPIQILGAFESSGQIFDALWFLGADDAHWPAVGRAHPLLPAWLQREAEMLHASPQADWILAQEATSRIVASAPVVVLSYPLQADGVALRPSPLLLAYAAQATPATTRPAPTLDAIGLEAIQDDSGRLPWPAQRHAGGADVLKRQAACAFQAFATLRLAARPLDEVNQGLDPAARGTLLHQVLEQLWSDRPGDPQRLYSLDDLDRAHQNDTLAAILIHHIQAVFAPRVAAAQGDPWTLAYLTCEKKRVHQRLRAWLSCELARAPFTVAALEKTIDFMQVGPLRLKVRLDRVDTLADGSHLLIDYKTGDVKTSAWMNERPEEPQLPLYALFSGIENVSAIAFARIRAGNTRLLACSEDPAGLFNPPPSRSQSPRLDNSVRDRWRENLLALADGFVEGDARVDPRNPDVTCKYCPLTGLCRVHSLTLDDDPSDSSDSIEISDPDEQNLSND